MCKLVLGRSTLCRHITNGTALNFCAFNFRFLDHFYDNSIYVLLHLLFQKGEAGLCTISLPQVIFAIKCYSCS